MDNSAKRTWPKAKRLATPAEFARVRLEGTSHRAGAFVMGALRVGGEPRSRVGLVTSRRVGNAVARNRTRRRMRELVRHHQNGLRPGFWIVLIARPSAAKATFRELEHDWLRLAERASILAP